MSNDTSAALGRIKAALDYKHRHVQLTEAQAREVLAHIADLEARAEKAEADVRTVQNAAKTLDAARQKIIGHYTRERQIDHVARTTLDSEREANAILTERVEALEARAKEAEAKVAAAEERGLVFNTLPDGRLDFCAIREGSRLWDGRVRAEAAEAREVTLRAALERIADEHWYRNGYCQTDIGVEPACSAEEAQKIAREALAAAARAQKEQKDD